MADEKPKEAAAAEEAPSGPKLIMGMPLPLFGFVALNVLTMLGGIGYITWVSLLYQKPPITEAMASQAIQSKVKQKVEHTEASTKEILADLEPMTIILKTARGGKNHYIAVHASLSCPSEKCAQQIKALKAKVEDTVQTAFAARSFTELSQLETKFRVKHEIITRINAYLTDTAITDLYFNEFLVQ